MISNSQSLPKELALQAMGEQMVGAIVRLLVENNLLAIPLEPGRNYSTKELLTILRDKVPGLDDDIVQAFKEAQDDLSATSNS